MLCTSGSVVFGIYPWVLKYKILSRVEGMWYWTSGTRTLLETKSPEQWVTCFLL